MIIDVGSDFWVGLFCVWVFDFLASVSFLVFRECDGCVLSVLLTSSANVFTGTTFW